MYLSDGGHFENLALYEMVLRRCRSIVVLDSGCDETFTYEDLGNALRKIRIDLKIPIKFLDGGVRRTSDAPSRRSITADGRPLRLAPVYVKPKVLGDEPPDVVSYARRIRASRTRAPANQWFDESQTESYRMLGKVTMDSICGSWTADGQTRRFRAAREKRISRVRARPVAAGTLARYLIQAIPSGPTPVFNRSTSSSVFRSITATLSSPVTAQYARELSGVIRMPASCCPSLMRFTSLRVARSRTTSSPASRSEISTSRPSGVNFRRFDRLVCTLNVFTTRFVARSMIETLPSRELAAQSCFPSGERSKPSGPLPTGTTVSFQLPTPARSIMLMLSRADVRGEDLALVGQRQHHVGAVLAGAEHHVHLVRRRVVAADHLVRLGGEVDLVADRPTARADGAAASDRRGAVPCAPRCRSPRACCRARAAAVVRDERQLAVRGRLHLVRLLARAHRSQHLFRRRVDDGERPLLIQDQQRLRGREPRRQRSTAISDATFMDECYRERNDA